MLSTVATLLGEPARTRILTALLTGRAMTAKESAYFAKVTAATASSHLSRLLSGHLLVMEKQGRCHYYRLRSAEVAQAIEGLMTVATIPSNGWPPHHRVEPVLREARMCYDHMAGHLGVAVCDMLLRRHHACSSTAVGKSPRPVSDSSRDSRRSSEGARREASLLPRLHRLDRAAPPHLRRCGRGPGGGFPRATPGRAHPRQPGPLRHAARPKDRSPQWAWPSTERPHPAAPAPASARRVARCGAPRVHAPPPGLVSPSL